MVGLVVVGVAALVLGILGLLADRLGVDTRDGIGDGHARGTR